MRKPAAVNSSAMSRSMRPHSTNKRSGNRSRTSTNAGFRRAIVPGIMPVCARNAITLSTLPSSATMPRIFVNIDQSLITCAVASTGFAGPANGTIASTLRCAASGMRGSSRPNSAAASAI